MKSKTKLKQSVYNQIRNDIPLRDMISKEIGITERSVYVYATRKAPTLNKPVVLKLLKKYTGLSEKELLDN